ncbi:MAG: DNA mismatch repair endonuclease MutL, partial [Cytophagaceae bacterium]|nr:DNA mismatch repair endonuclease MutL [Cytophagaceae bacterium]
MPDIIKLLPDAIANQIAAGEVVQRPASVVKELLENSIDSGAKSVQLIIKDAGKTLVQVVDDGKGMSPADARMSFERHATSKITKAEDLFALYSYGFRGEALASIAAVAQVELKTRADADEVGTCICIEGSEILSVESCSLKKGTSIQVKNLFFNIPARRNFLKSNQVELKHILDEFTRVALAYPEIAFSFYQNDIQTFNLQAKSLSERIVDLLGNAYREQLITCEEQTDNLTVKGFIGKPNSAKKTRGDQFFFVNRRFIKSGYLHHAVINAYEGLIPADTHPFYLLMLELPPEMIDVNVHPTKTEIKFEDERTVYGILAASIRRSIAKHHVTPSLDFEMDINIERMMGFQSAANTHNTEYRPHSGNGSGSYRTQHFGGEQKERGANWESLYNNIPAYKEEARQMESLVFSSAANHDRTISTTNTENPSTFQLHNQYIITQVKSGLVMIDQQAAHERILYERFTKNLRNKNGASQQSLFPQQLELTPADFTLMLSIEQELNALGFMFSVFGTHTIQLNGTPSEVTEGQEKEIFEGLLEQFKHFKSELKLDTTETLARSLAKRSCMKTGHPLAL